MAKTPSAPAAAPVLDEAVDVPGEGEAAPRRFKLRLPRLSLRMPAFLNKLPIPKIGLSKKMLLIVGLSLLVVGGAVAAAYAFWPAEPEWPRTPQPKKAKRAKNAASAPAAPAAAASQALAAASEAASAPVDAPAAAASGPEDPMDKLRRRLGEAMGGGKLQDEGPGELRLTTRRPADAASAAAAARRGGARSAAGAGAEPHDPGHDKPRGANARLTAGASMAHVHWSYEGLGGPESWGRLKPEYATCSSGTRQSPIDIRDGIQVQLEPIGFEYQPSRFGVIDNGHTVQVNVAPGNFIQTMGRRFELLQFHFHRPSEERIDGRQSDMAVHLVHKDAGGRLAIVAVLLERGGAQPVVQAVWNNLPLEKGEEQPAQVGIDLQQLLPAERGYFTYMGSLTTPPCSEGVLWMVMKQPVPISPEQLSIFARIYPMNARPLQSASGRLIKESGLR
jgi:carbonic anhydrase